LINENFNSGWYPNVEFRKLAPNEVNYRHKLFSAFGKLTLSRAPFWGMVRWDAQQNSVVAIGYLPWSTPFVMVWFWIIMQQFGIFQRVPSLNPVHIFLFFGVMSAIQFVGYYQFSQRVYEVLQKSK
jgi:hypothetical protein